MKKRKRTVVIFSISLLLIFLFSGCLSKKEEIVEEKEIDIQAELGLLDFIEFKIANNTETPVTLQVSETRTDIYLENKWHPLLEDEPNVKMQVLLEKQHPYGQYRSTKAYQEGNNMYRTTFRILNANKITYRTEEIIYFYKK